MDTVPSTPDPTLTTLVASGLKDLLIIAGAFGVTWGSSVSGSAIQIAAGGIAGLIGVGWGIYQRFQNSRHTHATAEASAKAGVPVQPAH